MSSQSRTVITVPDASAFVDTNVPPGRTFKGLCVNCDHRFTCAFQRPESGVWYCEEYR